MKQKTIPVAVPDIGELERRYALEAVESGWVSSLGAFIEKFETGFAEFCETRHAVAVANGTTAIEVTLAAFGVGRGDEVILPDLTFAAVAAAITHLGAIPVLVDVEPGSWCVDPRAVERALSPRTRAVVPVHSYGHPADLDPILEACRKRGIRVLEDAAEAHGARYRGRRVGSIGDAGSFSFYGNKIITTGEGGAVVTQDDDLAARVRVLKDHAMDPNRRYFHLEAGYNFRMTNVQAAIGCAQLERVGEFLERRAEILDGYRELLAGAPLRLNPHEDGAEPVNWTVCAVLEPSVAEHRDAILAEMRTRGVDTRPFFVRLSEMPPYRDAPRVGADGDDTPVARDLSLAGFNLPTSTLLEREDIVRVADAFRAALTAQTGG
jgi:perosamine synthetase